MKSVMKRNRGTSAIEFALVLTPLLFILLGIVDYGYTFFVQLTVTSAAREGARAASVGDDGNAKARQVLSAAGLTRAPAIQITRQADDVQASVTYPFLPLVGFLPTPRTIDSFVVMRVEGGS